jgi:membrane protease YdiL (CAAX protease family)
MISGKKYISMALAIYAIALLYLHFAFHLPFNEFYEVLFIVGIGFSSIAWLLTKYFVRPFDKQLIKNEVWILLGLIVWIAFYITFGGSLIDKIFPPVWLNNPQAASIIIFIKKLFVFVLFPFTIYRLSGFTLKDFGLKNTEVKLPRKKTTIVFILLSVTIILFQYFLSNGSKPIRSEQFNTLQMLIGLPLCFVYLILDAGLIEEFFFRGLIQSRLSLFLKSSVGGVVCTAVIFGLVHAPGLYLRGAASEGMEEQMPFLFWVAYTIVYMSVAGIFLGIVYNKTKNLYLVIVIHAMFDLLPNFPEFIRTWHL